MTMPLSMSPLSTLSLAYARTSGHLPSGCTPLFTRTYCLTRANTPLTPPMDPRNMILILWKPHSRQCRCHLTRRPLVRDPIPTRAIPPCYLHLRGVLPMFSPQTDRASGGMWHLRSPGRLRRFGALSRRLQHQLPSNKVELQTQQWPRSPTSAISVVSVSPNRKFFADT